MPGSDAKLRSVAQRFAKITRTEIEGQNVKTLGSWLNNAIIYLNNNNRLPADVIPLIVKSMSIAPRRISPLLSETFGLFKPPPTSSSPFTQAHRDGIHKSRIYNEHTQEHRDGIHKSRKTRRRENIPTMNTTQELPNGRRDNKECTKAEKSNESANTSNHLLSI